MSKQEQWFNVGHQPQLTVECGGDLIVRGTTDTSVVARGDDYTVEANAVRGSGDLRLLVPRRCTLTVTYVGGDFKLKGLQGDLTVEEVGGDLKLAAVSGALTARRVHGDLSVSQIGGHVSLGEIHGDCAANHVGGLTIQTVYGDLSATRIAGAVSAAAVHGDASLQQVTGDVALTNVSGDCTLANLAGRVQVTGRDDVRLSGPLTAGKHQITAASTLTLFWPDKLPVSIAATAPTIRNRLPLENVSEAAGSLSGAIGVDGPAVILSAGERITLRPDDGGREPLWDGVFEINLELEAAGQSAVEQINSRVAELAQRMGPEINTQVERALRRAQASIDQAIAQMEQTLQRAEAQAGRRAGAAAAPPPPPEPKAPRPPKPPKPPTPPTPEATDTSAEQLKILKMLEEGVISIEEANALLAALG